MPRRLLIAAWLLALLTPAGALGAGDQLLSGPTVEAALRRHVLDHSPWRPAQLDVTLVSYRPVSVPEGRIGLRVLRPRRGLSPGQRSFLLAAQVEGREALRTWVRADVRVFDRVVVTSQPLAHHEAVRAGDVRLERRDLSAVTGGRPFTAVEEVVAQEAARAIEVNEVLTTATVGPRRVVRRGSRVVLAYETARLRVEVGGQAMDGGRVGDLIRVKNVGSGRIVQGQIVDGRTVRVNW